MLIPPTVLRELQHENTPSAVRAWAEALPRWIKIQAPAFIDPSLNVDEGEREAICLAREVKAMAILIDDRKGRLQAVRCGLRVAGTIGILEAAANRGLVDFRAAIERLRETNARLGDEVIQAALARVQGRDD